jgi:membrane protein DedA with SNARE-associated domain
MDFAKLVTDHGYLVTFIGALIEGETVLTLAGLAAHRGYLHLSLLIALATLGSLIGDQIYFLIGRRFGKRLIARFPRFKPAIRRVDALVVRYAGVAVIAVRFLYGLRTLGPIAMGASRMPWRIFAMFNAAGAIVWSAVWLTGGYLIGEIVHMLIGDLHHKEVWVFAGVVAAALAMGTYLHFNRRAAARPRRKRN